MEPGWLESIDLFHHNKISIQPLMVVVQTHMEVEIGIHETEGISTNYIQLEHAKALEIIIIFSTFVSRSITTVWSSGPLTSGFSRIPRSPVKLCLVALLRPLVAVVHCLARTSKFQRTKFVSSHQIQKALNLNRPRWALWFFQIQLKETIFFGANRQLEILVSTGIEKKKYPPLTYHYAQEEIAAKAGINMDHVRL